LKANCNDGANIALHIVIRRHGTAFRLKDYFSNLQGGLGVLFGKYEIAAQASLPITSDIFAHVFPRERGTRLALVEIAQLQGRHADAMAHVERLLLIDPTDPVVLLSFS
jgi:hypothetical protein